MRAKQVRTGYMPPLWAHTSLCVVRWNLDFDTAPHLSNHTMLRSAVSLFLVAARNSPILGSVNSLRAHIPRLLIIRSRNAREPLMWGDVLMHAETAGLANAPGVFVSTKGICPISAAELTWLSVES